MRSQQNREYLPEARPLTVVEVPGDAEALDVLGRRGTWYRVRMEADGRCHCLGFQYHHRCAHLKAAREYARLRLPCPACDTGYLLSSCRYIEGRGYLLKATCACGWVHVL